MPFSFADAVKITWPLRTTIDPPDDSPYEERCPDCAGDIVSCTCDPDMCPICGRPATHDHYPYDDKVCAILAEADNAIDGL